MKPVEKATTITIVFLVLIIILLMFYLNYFTPQWYCHLAGMGGVSDVPANCIKYFVK